MNFGLVLAGYSLPEWQAVKLTMIHDGKSYSENYQKNLISFSN